MEPRKHNAQQSPAALQAHACTGLFNVSPGHVRYALCSRHDGNGLGTEVGLQKIPHLDTCGNQLGLWRNTPQVGDFVSWAIIPCSLIMPFNYCSWMSGLKHVGFTVLMQQGQRWQDKKCSLLQGG